jgi:3-hydroxyacyl-[acyl-carrier-protein] dehydratase
MKMPLNIIDIQKAIPHRFPFLLVDRVLEMELGKRIVAIKNVTFNEAHFQGHFPSRPLMPGVLSVEAMAQAAGVLTRYSFDPDFKIEALFFAGIDSVRFRRPIEPGDTLRLEVALMKKRTDFYKYTGVAKVGDEIASSAEFLLTTGRF